ncbi:hypothetical protein K438DRAFT_1716271 [Mycena galopus ATCC 62051]|nr:hypothetical protein K438DRAFT_1745211 [Mycena galopus ATCC 62051]KAF8203428.1 hypothetical protein K438DRAFT_1716271 [Mycena galopus ATCC 62051]
MGRKASTLPPIGWAKDKGALIWKMLKEVEKKEYRLVIMGKKDSSENSSGMSKAAAFKAIGKTILPDEAAIDEDAVGKRHAKRLRQTGGGVGGNDDDGDESLHEFMSCYIPTGGPDNTTTPDAKNLWEAIVKEFPFFPFFHNLYSTRANVNPPVVITGVGPTGRKIVHLQPPSGSVGVPFPDHLIDPKLMNLVATPPPPPSRGSSPIHWSPTPSPVKTPRSPLKPLKENRDPSTQKPKVKHETPLSAAILRARENVKKIPAKRSLEDTLISLHENTMKQTAKRGALQDELAQRRLMLDEKAQLIEMHRLGIYNKEEFLAQLSAIEARFKVATQPSPAKRPRLSDSSSDVEVL